MSPLRILCIHGYKQNGSTFREKTGAFRKLLKKQVELIYLNAPQSAQQTSTDEAPEKASTSGAGGYEASRAWWFSDVQAQTFNALQQCEESLGLDESVAAVRGAVKEQGPFDGILGFSQGAAFVAMLCSLQERGLEPDFNFRFAVIVAGFRSACQEHQVFYNLPLHIPSLHVFGLEDRVIPDNMSRDLLPTFQEPVLLIHPGGHFIPATAAHRETYQNFLKRFQ